MDAANKNCLKVIFPVLDLKQNNIYNLVKFETLLKEPIKIEKEKTEVNIYLNQYNNMTVSINEKVTLIPNSKEYKEKEYIITLFREINNIFTLNVNEDGDCSLEINSMWDVNYDDYEDNTIIQERKINEIEYNGKKIENYEKLYERKRWNLLNAKIDNFQKGLFSDQTIDYMKKNKNKSYKYDILLNKEGKTLFLSEKFPDEKTTFFEEDEKQKFKDRIKLLNAELLKKIKAMEDSKKTDDKAKTRKILYNFLEANKSTFKDLEDNFQLYNGKWDLDNFSEKDFELFLLFSELQLYLKKYISFKDIPIDIREQISPQFQKLKENVKSNNSLDLIEKTRIICSFSKFCSKSLHNFEFPELYIVNELKEEDPFKMAIEKYRSIIDNLKENSGLFKKLLLFDMGSTQIINEWDFKDFKIENLLYWKSEDLIFSFNVKFIDFKKEFTSNQNKKKVPNDKDKLIQENNIQEEKKLTFPVLSMITLDQIKKHCFDLLPKFFFKIPDNYRYNALSITAYRISFFNEYRILNKNDLKKGETYDPKECVLPIMIELSHEVYSHLKIRYSNLSSESPLLNPIKGDKKLLCPNDYNPECGYFLEYFIADNYEELKHLKFKNINLFPLTEFKYWTDINFNKMKEFNKKEMEKEKNNNNKNDNNNNDNNDNDNNDNDNNINNNEIQNTEEDYYNFISYDKGRYDDDDVEVFRCVFKKYNS